MKYVLILGFVLFGAYTSVLSAQTPNQTTVKTLPQVDGPSNALTTLPVEDSVLVTIILKHQQDKNLTEIRRKLELNGFWDIFPPKDARLVSWNIVMGLGQVVTLYVPAQSVRNLNLSIQNGAWGAYSTEIYLSYDYLPILNDYINKRNESKEDKD